MAETDNPLKLLVDDFPLEFATWLLKRDIIAAEPLKTELVSEPITADHISQVTLADGRTALLHIEFQGRSSDPPMPRRMLDYTARIARDSVGSPVRVCSVVMYVGQGAGASDTGDYVLECLDDADLTLHWRHRVLRLWQMPAKELLQAGHPALAAMIGQTRITEPEAVLSEAVRQIRTVPDGKQRGLLAGVLLALIEPEDLSTMVEKMVAQDNLLVDSPFLRRIRSESREEGERQGELKGVLNTLRQNIVQSLATRFSLTETAQESIAARLAGISEQEQLNALFITALQVDSPDAFEASLPDEAAPVV